jgi:hypothetical protein
MVQLEHQLAEAEIFTWEKMLPSVRNKLMISRPTDVSLENVQICYFWNRVTFRVLSVVTIKAASFPAFAFSVFPPISRRT